MVITEVASKEIRMVMLQRWLIKWRDNGPVMEVASLKKGE